MGHIAILCDDLQPRNSVAVSHDIVEHTRAILLDPFTNKFSVTSGVMRAYQGNSYGMSDPLAFDAEAMRDASYRDKP
jgi:hypothetical protein